MKSDLRNRLKEKTYAGFPAGRFLLAGIYRVLAVIIFTAISVMALTAKNISGSVCDEKGNAIAGATIELRKVEGDSTVIIRATVADENGRFDISGAEYDETEGNTILTVHSMGYHSRELKPRASEGELTISLQTDHTALPEIEVVQKRIEFNPGGYTVNLAGNKLAMGKNAPELLGYLPGISYDRIRGLEVLCRKPEAIYIDGIKTASWDEIAKIPATEISSVEIKYMGGVGESGTSTGSIVYITLKQLWDGSYSGYLYGLAKGYYDIGFHSASISPDFRMKKGKLTLSDTGGYGYQRLKSEEMNNYVYRGEDRDIPAASIADVKEVSYTDHNRGHFNNVWNRFTLNYQLPENGMLSGSVFYTHMTKDISKHVTPDNPAFDTQELLTPDHNNNVQAALKLRQPLKNGAQVNAALDYIMDETLVNQRMTTTPPAEQDYQTSERTFKHQLRGKANISLPIGSGRLNSGADFQYTRVTDRYELHHLDATQRTEMNSYFPAVFAEYSGDIKNFSYSIGARAQGYIADVCFGGETAHRDQWGICPSADLMYTLDRERGHMLSLGYYYTLNQLPYTLIMSRPMFSGPHSYTTGNPDLKAARSHGATLMAQLFNRYSISARFSYSTDNIDFKPTLLSIDPGMFLYTPYNCPEQWGISVSADGVINPFEWWTLRPSVSMSKDRTHTLWGVFSSNVAWSLSLSSTMRLPHDMGLAVSYLYEGENRYSEVTLKPVNYLYGSFYKYLFNRAMQITLDITIYQTRRKAITRTPEAERIYYHKTHNENIEIGVAWFFKGGKRERIKTENAIFQRLQQIPNTKL